MANISLGLNALVISGSNGARQSKASILPGEACEKYARLNKIILLFVES